LIQRRAAFAIGIAPFCREMRSHLRGENLVSYRSRIGRMLVVAVLGASAVALAPAIAGSESVKAAGTASKSPPSRAPRTAPKATASAPVAAPHEADTAHAAPKPAAVQEIKARLDLRGPFNIGRGKVRLVAFFSPTCIHCIENAARLQAQLFDKNKSPDIEMHVVWIKALQTDTRASVDRATQVLHDPRVQHYWDSAHVLNAQLLDAVQFDVQVRFFDVVLLYDRKASWDTRLPRPNYWMHEYRGAPGPSFDADVFALQVQRGLDNQTITSPQ
jgi:hypothetical protein